MANRTTAAKKAYEDYKNSNVTSLWEVYGRYSKAKEEALDYCKALCYEKHGRGLRIISANTFQFTAGFVYEEDGKNMFMYITKNYDTPIEIAEVA